MGLFIDIAGKVVVGICVPDWNILDNKFWDDGVDDCVDDCEESCEDGCADGCVENGCVDDNADDSVDAIVVEVAFGEEADVEYGVNGWVGFVFPELICWEIILPLASTITVLVITVGTLI